VTVVEFGDFECPACRQAHPAVQFMLRHFGQRVRVVFRHFPHFTDVSFGLQQLRDTVERLLDGPSPA
jgi:protein-disulfide isomerase